MLRFATTALVALAACASALYEDDEHVTKFSDPSAFEKSVFDDDASVWVIHLYHGDAEKDGQSPALADAYGETTAELLDGLGVKAGCIDVADEGMQKTLQRLSIVGVPSFLGFGAEKAKNPYTKKTDRPVVRFPQDSGFSKTSFKRWVSGKVMPTDAVERVTDAKALKAAGPAAVLLTERITTSALAKSLGVALRGRLAVAEVLVDKNPTPLAKALAGDDATLPKLLASKKAYKDGDALDEYTGDLKDREAVLAWLEGYASKERKAKPEKKATKDEAPAPGDWPKEYGLLKVADDAAFQATVVQAEAAVVASSLNCYVVRSPEIATGIPLFDEHGDPVLPMEDNTSSIAARKGVESTTASRAILQAPVYFVPSLLMGVLPPLKKLVASHPAARVPITTFLVLTSFGLGLPATIAIFPQVSQIKAEDAEPKYQHLINPATNKPYEVFYYNKGL